MKTVSYVKYKTRMIASPSKSLLRDAISKVNFAIYLRVNQSLWTQIEIIIINNNNNSVRRNWEEFDGLL